MPEVTIVYWRDIPAQVVGRAGRKSTFKKELEPRFATAIDRAAMRAGRGLQFQQAVLQFKLAEGKL